MIYKIRPISRDDARAFVARVHRHLGPPVGDMFRVALTADDVVVGVGIAGRPVARGSDDGRTIEIIRVAVEDGLDCGCSRIYGALRRAAVALGYDRVITYTLAEEPGTSLRAAGFIAEARSPGGDWSNAKRPRGEPDMFGNAPKRHLGPKVRWSWGETLRVVPSWDSGSGDRREA